MLSVALRRETLVEAGDGGEDGAALSTRLTSGSWQLEQASWELSAEVL